MGRHGGRGAGPACPAAIGVQRFAPRCASGFVRGRSNHPGDQTAAPITRRAIIIVDTINKRVGTAARRHSGPLSNPLASPETVISGSGRQADRITEGQPNQSQQNLGPAGPSPDAAPQPRRSRPGVPRGGQRPTSDRNLHNAGGSILTQRALAAPFSRTNQNASTCAVAAIETCVAAPCAAGIVLPALRPSQVCASRRTPGPAGRLAAKRRWCGPAMAALKRS